MAALMGVPQSLSEHDVTAQLPEFAAQTSKSLALGIHVKLARATSSILQSELASDHCDVRTCLGAFRWRQVSDCDT